jgi:hypothetical protein
LVITHSYSAFYTGKNPLTKPRCIVATVVLRLTCNNRRGRGKRIGVSAGRRVGEREKRIGVSAGRRIGTRGAVGLRSRATGVARLETSLLLITPPQPFILRSLLFACSSSITCNAGRAGAQPYRATRADTPTRRPADPPIRRYVSPARGPADPPIRRFVSPDSPSLTLAVFRQERAGICASMLTKPGKRPASCFRLIQIQSSVGGCSPVDSALLDVRWRIARGARPLRLSFIF